MTMLKTLVRKDGGCDQIQRYIEKEGECLAYDYSPGVDRPDDWAQEFDEVRQNYAKDFGRKYYHLIISPDPSDSCDLETMRDLATSWMRQRYPDAQYVIGYHNDNGRIHAHIAMNSVIPETGYKIQISDRDVVEDTLTLQHMSRDRGLSYFEHPHPHRTNDGWEASVGEQKRPAVVYTDAERRLMQKGITPWKQQIRDAIDASLRESATWDEFARSLEKRNITASIGRRNIVTYTLHDEEGNARKVRGTADNLGSAYTVRGVMTRMSLETDRRITGVRQPSEHKKVAVPETMNESIERRARRRPWLDPQEVADLISIMRQNDYPDIRDLNDDLEASRQRLDALQMDLAQAEARADMLNEADKKIEEWERYTYGNDTASLMGSIDSYFELQALEQWFADVGIDPESFEEDREELIAEARIAAQRVSDACEQEKTVIAALAQASKTAERLCMPMRETPQQRGARTRRTTHSVIPRHIASREELAQAQMSQMERTAARFERSEDEQLKQLANMQRELILQKQIEDATAPPQDEAALTQATHMEDQRAVEEQTHTQAQQTAVEQEQVSNENRSVLPYR